MLGRPEMMSSLLSGGRGEGRAYLLSPEDVISGQLLKANNLPCLQWLKNYSGLNAPI